MKNLKKKFLFFSVFLFSFLFLTHVVFIPAISEATTLWDEQTGLGSEDAAVPAADKGAIGKSFGGGVVEVGSVKNVPKNQMSAIVAKIIKAALGLLGIIFVVLLVVAGFKYMTAGGDEEQVKTSLTTIKQAVIGLIIVVMAYAITYYVFSTL